MILVYYNICFIFVALAIIPVGVVTKLNDEIWEHSDIAKKTSGQQGKKHKQLDDQTGCAQTPRSAKLIWKQKQKQKVKLWLKLLWASITVCRPISWLSVPNFTVFQCNKELWAIFQVRSLSGLPPNTVVLIIWLNYRLFQTRSDRLTAM